MKCLLKSLAPEKKTGAYSEEQNTHVGWRYPVRWSLSGMSLSLQINFLLFYLRRLTVNLASGWWLIGSKKKNEDWDVDSFSSLPFGGNRLAVFCYSSFSGVALPKMFQNLVTFLSLSSSRHDHKALLLLVSLGHCIILSISLNPIHTFRFSSINLFPARNLPDAKSCPWSTGPETCPPTCS